MWARIILIVLILLLCDWKHGIAPPTYYFNTSGSDSNNCLSQGSACQTISHLNGLALPSGATVLFQGGQSFTGAIVLTTGVTSGPVTLGSYGAGSATISSTTSACLTSTDVPGVTVNGLNCTGSGDTVNTTDGIEVINDQAGNTKLAGLTISDNVITGYGRNGIYVSGTNGTSGFNNIAITNNVSHDVTGATTDHAACIQVGAVAGSPSAEAHTNLTVTGNLVYNCIGKGGGQSACSGCWNGAGITIGESGTVLLSRNVSHDLSTTSASGTVGIWAINSTGVTISFNEAYNTNSGTAGGITSPAFDIDVNTTNSIMEYNYSHNNSSVGYAFFSGSAGLGTVWSGNIARYNVSEDDGYAYLIGPYQSTSMTTCAMYNNTAYGASQASFSTTGDGTGSANCPVNNNIWNGPVLVAAIFSLTLDYNDYDSVTSFNWNGTGYSTFATFKSGSSQEAHGTAANPSLTSPGSGGTCYSSGTPAGPQPCPSAYVLQGGSAMIGVGVSIASPGSRDYYANTIPNGVGSGYNIGTDGGNP